MFAPEEKTETQYPLRFGVDPSWKTTPPSEHQSPLPSLQSSQPEPLPVPIDTVDQDNAASSGGNVPMDSQPVPSIKLHRVPGAGWSVSSPPSTTPIATPLLPSCASTVDLMHE